MNKKDLKKFKDILEGRKDEIVKAAEAQKDQGIGFSQDDLPDEVDLASSEAEQSMSLRLRDRERVLLKKIDKTLKKIEDGDYGICEQCGEEIGVKRLEARPVTDLCIRCKEEQEKMVEIFGIIERKIKNVGITMGSLQELFSTLLRGVLTGQLSIKDINFEDKNV